MLYFRCLHRARRFAFLYRVVLRRLNYTVLTANITVVIFTDYLRLIANLLAPTA